jgi:hypothetical protein
LRQSLAAVFANSNRLADSNAQLYKILEMIPSWEHADHVHHALGVNLEKSGDPAAPFRNTSALLPSIRLSRSPPSASQPSAHTNLNLAQRRL